MEEVRLIKKAKKGDKEALLTLIMNEKDAYYRLAYAYMGNSHDAMDALEDMIVVLYDKINQLKKDRSFYSWSKTILVNECKAALRRRSKQILTNDWQAAIEPTSSSNSFLASEQQADLEAMLSELSHPQRETLQLRYFHDLDYETIASITDVSLGTVKSRIFQGLKKLREKHGGVNE
ncbi:RNA polymerase sigma factor [Cytobacillus gottheilii]|uniref:RNA polymerase sigma factor n=1 Tax=Cytobacillus gottheilii TaxID=859144 RepID=UPI0009BBA457|nr:RNA polymerase sigma factor [Cytobacillus gottheilii]